MPEKRTGVSADLLKLTALVTMLIDHIGAGILEYFLTGGIVRDASLSRLLTGLDAALRTIGRISFPLFCFLLAEGYAHTKSRGRYAARLFVFALLSELPFDLLFSGSWNPDSQNVFWTLLIGLLTLWGMDASGRAARTRRRSGFWEELTGAAGMLAVLAMGMGSAQLLKTDYSWRGVLLIGILRLLRRDRLLLVIYAPCAFLFSEFLELLVLGAGLSDSLETVLSHMTVFLSFFLIRSYNGRRKRRGHPYFFYLFYPLHLLVLYVCRLLLFALYG